jgi:hypothetical protein
MDLRRIWLMKLAIGSNIICRQMRKNYPYSEVKRPDHSFGEIVSTLSDPFTEANEFIIFEVMKQLVAELAILKGEFVFPKGKDRAGQKKILEYNNILKLSKLFKDRLTVLEERNGSMLLKVSEQRIHTKQTILNKKITENTADDLQALLEKSAPTKPLSNA